MEEKPLPEAPVIKKVDEFSPGRDLQTTYFASNLKTLCSYFRLYVDALRVHGGLIFFHVTVNFPKVGNFIDDLRLKHIMNKDNRHYYQFPSYFLEKLFFQISKLEFSDVAFGVMENNEELTHPHVHILLGFRAISNNTEALCIHTERTLKGRENNFYGCECSQDIVVKPLPHQKDIFNVITYLTKNMGKNIYDHWYIGHFSDVLHHIHHTYFFQSSYRFFILKNLYCKLINRTYIKEYCEHYFLDGCEEEDFYYDPELHEQCISNFTHTLSGYKFDQDESPVFLLLYYLSLYFQIKDMFLYKGNLYQRIYKDWNIDLYISKISYKEKSLFAYKHLGDLFYFQTQIPTYLEELTSWFKTLSRDTIQKYYSMNLEPIIKKMDQISFFTKRELNYDILEFKDCVYFANYNRFILKNKNELQILNRYSFITTRYYDYSFNYIKFFKFSNNSLWLKKIKTQFTKKELHEFCCAFADILFDSKINTKSKAIVLLGNSGTGKTSTVMNVASEAYGSQNTGTLNLTDKKFTFSNIKTKDLVIGDEMSYIKSIRGDLLKLLSNEMLGVTQKYKDTVFEQLTNNIILAGNRTPDLLRMLQDDAFINRINLFIFDQRLDLSNREKKQIEREIPLILIYCARIRYQHKTKKGQYRRKLIRKEWKELSNITSTDEPSGPSFGIFPINPTNRDE